MSSSRDSLSRENPDVDLDLIVIHPPTQPGQNSEGHGPASLRPVSVDHERGRSPDSLHGSENPPSRDDSQVRLVSDPKSRDGSQVRHVSFPPTRYTLERYFPRSTLNTLGPVLVTLFYLFIVATYLLRPAVNGIIPYFPIDARGVFFAWLVFSIFVLDWAKSGLAGFEAAALMKRSLAPRTAMQLIWHADRAWGSISGWWRALTALYDHLFRVLLRKPSHGTSSGPSGLWWYLSLSSFLFYAAIPLASLSMDPKDAMKLGDRKILMTGVNQTTFDMRTSNGVAEQANGRWRQGNPTTPQGDTIFYAPQGTKDVSDTYYEDAIQTIYRGDSGQGPVLSGSVSFFSGPQVSERATGRAWGILTNLSCSVAHPYKDLKLLKIKAINNWTAPYSSSKMYGTTFKSILAEQFFAGLQPTLFNNDQSTGVSYQYLIATNGMIEGGSDYINNTILPLNGSLELAMWQSYKAPFKPDLTFTNLSSHPSVVSSFSQIDNLTYLGYGIQCNVNSSVGFANLDAATRTYSNFSTNAAVQAKSAHLGSTALNAYPGILAIESLVYGAFTTVILEYGQAPVCSPATSVTCNPWYGANVATGGVPAFVTSTSGPNVGDLQYPTIDPRRMKLALYKLFGEAAIAMMASGPGSFVSEMRGLEPANDLVPGIVPWQVVLALLSVWTVITVVPNCWTFAHRRWAATLDGMEMFRLGAEWRDVVWRFQGDDFRECKSLAEVPGMVGDMEPAEVVGFIGLSRYTANRKGREYTYNKGAVR